MSSSTGTSAPSGTAIPAAARSAAILSVVHPYPADSGKKVVLDGLLRHLVDRFGADDVHYLLIGGEGMDIPAGFPATLHLLPAPSAKEKLANLLTRVATGRSSLQEALTRSGTVQRAIVGLLGELDVDLEVYDTVRVGQYAPTGGTASRVCYLDDLFSERYRMMLDRMRSQPELVENPLGTFAAHVPGPLRRIADSPLAQRALLSFERRMIERSEIAAARRFDRCLLVNAGECRALAEKAGVRYADVAAIPPMVQARGRRDFRGAPEFVFLGLLSQPWNADGLRGFVEEVWPELLRRRPDARLRVIGKQAPAWLTELAAQQPENVLVEGYVEDLDTALAGAAAMLNPARFGTGVKIKVIEAIGRGVPVVSTPLGADGVASGRGTGVLTPADVESTVAELLRLTDVAENRRESAAARAHHTRRYGREAAFAAYDQAFGLAGGSPDAAEGAAAA
jgi:glycosyltransferase involved in cell wall biosynthesis